MDDFYHQFKQNEVALREVINSISHGSLTEEENQAAIESSLAGISQLSNEVKNAAGRLPAHDLQHCSKVIDSVTKTLREVRSASVPKKKFAFKKSGFSTPVACPSPSASSPGVRKPVTTNNEAEEPNVGPCKPVPQQTLPSTLKACTGFRLSNLNATYYVLTSSVSEGASMASLEDIQASFIEMSIPESRKTSFATLMINNVKESLLICGTIPGSARMTDVRNSTIVITARQIRVHDCKNVVIYLQCSSRPIIEDCNDIRFAPLPIAFVTEDSKGQSNMWDQVDDFKWLKAEPSPNWSILKSEDDRAINDESWKEICGGQSSSHEVEELLERAKIYP